MEHPARGSLSAVYKINSNLEVLIYVKGGGKRTTKRKTLGARVRAHTILNPLMMLGV